MTTAAEREAAFVWTEANVSVLMRMVADGFTMSAIGAELGVSRSAVIGKFHRVSAKSAGLNSDAKPRPRPPSAPVVRERALQKPNLDEVRRKRPATFDGIEPGHRFDLSRYRCEGVEPVTMDEHGARQCRFPLEDWQTPASARTLLCGAVTETDASSWCAAHARVVFGSGTRSEQSAEKVLRRAVR